jgi:glycosyltransferase involved in cell wall biosynthesis
MAMAMPIVATEVGDMPAILDGCGLTIKPGRPRLLATAIECVFEDYGEAKKMGERARAECIARYTYDAVGDDLLHVFKKYG